MTVDETLQQVFRLALPEAALVGVACVLFILSTLRIANRRIAGLFALIGIALAAWLHFAGPAPVGIRTVAPLWPDGLAAFVRLAALATGAVLVLFSWNECDDARAADYHACLLIATAGLSLVGSANDLIVLFLALELISIPTYVMLYLPRSSDARAQEAAIKYFMLSVLSTAFTLFGFSYLYGTAGTTNISALTQLLPRLAPGDGGTTILIASVLVLAGLGFRVTAFPFHFYAPDVYQGGPTGTVAFLAFVPKIAGFAALLRLFGYVGEANPVANEFVKRIMMLLWLLAAITMTAGNVMGLLQTNLRRLLAYSSVANAGYMLIGLAVIPAQAYRVSTEPSPASGGEALLFYLIAYGAMTVGAFRRPGPSGFAGQAGRIDRRYCRFARNAPGVGGADGNLLSQPHRLSAYGRLLRQAVALFQCVECTSRSANARDVPRAGRRRSAERSRCGLLLLARIECDVPAQARFGAQRRPCAGARCCWSH